MLVIGLMSGTSADGVDAALVEWPDEAAALPFRLVAYRETAFPRELQARIHALAAGTLAGPEVLRELIALDVELGERFARAAIEVADEAGVDLREVDAVASHGQTVAHHPDIGGTLQIGCPSRIAERTRRPVVADFRRRDLAAGGEGAPLAPFLHAALLGDPDEARGVLNLGGIANLTWLPKGPDPDGVLAFDVGPANSLIDGVVQILSEGDEGMDVDGARAARGRVDDALLARLLDDDYLRRPPPKSTGRERYGRAEAEKLVADWRAGGLARDDDDLLATLCAFTCEAVAQACRTLLPPIDTQPPSLDRLLVGGGGAANPSLMSMLGAALPGTVVEPMDSAGVPAAAAEAMAFSLMGRNTLLGVPNQLPACTGASRSLVLGQIVPAC